jgi:outer membrane phospholipase A
MDKSIIRDEKGVRRQVYKRDKGLIPVNGTETEALMEVMKQQFLPNAPSKSNKKYESLTDFKNKIIEYFDYITKNNKDGADLIPDIEGFCCFAGICRDTLNDWERSRPGEYSDTIKAFKNSVASYKKQLALKGKIPPIVFATDFNNNHGYTQKQDIQITANNQLTPTMDLEQIAEKVKSDVVVDADWKEE